ncbi:type II toxin-antitoxin system Phd/YefM family antitoxin [Paracoccus lutimaris]|uniref:Antitoxin n=1 Tax=Paracoccus lutimaris TaxID=1490030 RepID=A0A368YF98_9RHOB|nr:type II toxin-antitoxin system Phd/YefM family antitoxin [Paracoccus lutimaris]RCW78910.1 prevent-host-death family protein [Paracoccus lutimaris]
MWTLQDAKNRFSAVVDAALAGQPQEVSRRGKPAVVVMAAEEYRRLLDSAREDRGSFVAHLMAFPDDGSDESDLPRGRVTPRDVRF